MVFNKVFNKRLAYLYLLVLFTGSVVPLFGGSTILSDNYTLHIRWDYLVHMLIYLPLPAMLAVIFRQKANTGQRPQYANTGPQLQDVITGQRPHDANTDPQLQDALTGPQPQKAATIRLWNMTFRLWIPVVLLALVITVLFEMVQKLVPYRTFNINDMLANGVGVLIGLVLVALIRKILR